MCFGGSSVPDPDLISMRGPEGSYATGGSEDTYATDGAEFLGWAEPKEEEVELGYTRKRLSGQTLRGSQRIGGVNPRSLFQLR